MTVTRAVPVLEAGGAAEARRAAVELARRLGFDETDVGRVAIVASEAATNLAKHAGGGTVLLSAVRAGGSVGLELLGLDAGPGIADIDRALRDGHSSAGSLGTGLGAIRRLAGDFEIHSTRERGTALLARLWPRTARERARPRLETAGVSVAKPGERDCGDAWAVSEQPGCPTVLVVDGLGHGPAAVAAAEAAVRLFHERPGLGPAPLLERLHDALRSTRGAAAAAVQIDLERRRLTFAGIGNVAGVIVDGGRRSLPAHGGILGHQVRRVQAFEYPWPPDGLLVLHTDGLASHWSLDGYRGLAARHPGLVAGVLYRDFRRDQDDATVVVAREWPP